MTRPATDLGTAGEPNGLPAALFYTPPEDLDGPNGKAARAFGSGRRLVVPVDPGRKLITLVSPATLARVRVALTELRRATPAAIRPARLARRLEVKAALYRRLGVDFDRKVIRRAIARLRSL